MRRLIKCWAGVEITDAVGKGKGCGRLESLADTFKEKVGLHRIYITAEN